MKLLCYATHPGFKIPTKANPSDVGWDVYAVEETMIAGGGIAKIRIGGVITAGGSDGRWYIRVADRSSNAVRGLHTLAGVVDPGYRGELCVVLANLTGVARMIRPGDKVAQLIVERVHNVDEAILVDGFDTTDRGSKGFGSSC